VGTSNSKIPWALRWVQDISTIRWGFEALCLNEFDGLEFQVRNPVPLRLPRIMPKFINISGRDVLARLDIDPRTATLPRALGAQTTILLASYLLTYLGLRFRAPRFQPLLPPPAGGGSVQVCWIRGGGVWVWVYEREREKVCV
jgi:hypothetical protein